MQINNSMNFIAYQANSQRSAAHDDADPSFSTMLTDKTSFKKEATADIQKSDFTNMTRKELTEWIQSTTGEFSPKGFDGFMGLIHKIKVGPDGNPMGVPLEGDNEKFNFIQAAQDGIEGARFRNEDTAVKSLELALALMRKFQGEAIGIKTQA